MIDHFTIEEKTCHCGCGLNKVDENPDFLRALNTARELYGKPMDAESMTRCVKHNKKVGGAPYSAHLDGRAIDIRCADKFERIKMQMALLTAGFRRFEIKPTNLHADMKVGAPDMLAIKTEKGIV
ncbi:MAG: D-Ala-D-Ala carboxypeptidase family metallohydrolase [Candidatus Omnitrophica bacterium]|nr:D-Ala-D-Ala carboxypeptidase family metallohydrolase [Candidatus Omnitrophota bacterium]